MKIRNVLYISFVIILIVLAIYACMPHYFRANYTNTNKLLHDTKDIKTKPFLKAHLRNGDVCILTDTWRVDTVLNVLTGKGKHYNFNRSLIFEGSIRIPVDSVVIFETNKKILYPENGRIIAICILVAVELAIGIVCITNPKACFGSCPTFYINEKDNFHYADAEGFTNAISPSMEYGDIDALNNKSVLNHQFSITMKNEALETHCVNDVKLLAYPRNENERIYHSSADVFYLCENNYPINKAIAEEGDVSSLLLANDRVERFSLSDESDLNSKEEIFIDFENVKQTKDLAMLINFRQTLMNTYLFYSAMGYMGDNVGDVFSILERNETIKNKFDATTKVLGGIDVYILNTNNGKWDFQGKVDETGPIALNKQIVSFNNTNLKSAVKLKLVMNKGLWRIDYVALTNIKEKVKPLEILPNSIFNKGKEDKAALMSMSSQSKYLISMPGSEYKFNFILPKEHLDYELFLYSKGYYLEWMREHWLKDKNIFKLKQMVLQPKRYLKLEAKAYKHYEGVMEQEFWNSKIDTKTFSYYEN